MIPALVIYRTNVVRATVQEKICQTFVFGPFCPTDNFWAMDYLTDNYF